MKIRIGIPLWLKPLVLATLGLFAFFAPTMARAQFLFVTNAGSITITGYTGSGGTVVIPSVINGFPVTSIGDDAFGNYQFPPIPPPVIPILPLVITNPIARTAGPQGITNVVIPGSVTNLGTSAFLGCTNLVTLELSNGLLNIGDDAFYRCMRLSRVTIPGSVTAIGNSAFETCTSLASAVLGSGVTNVGEAAFGNCPKLTAITVDTNNADYRSLGGVLFDKNQATLEQYPAGKLGTYTVPASVQVIAAQAFISCTKLTGVVIPDTVTTIGSDAFEGCSSLSSIVIPDRVTEIGAGMFLGCINLIEVTIGSGVTNVASLDALYGLSENAFVGCPKLTSIAVSARNANYSSANGVLFNKNQTTLVQCPPGKGGTYTIPSSVTSVADTAFADCTMLDSILIPGSVTSLGSDAFSGCVRLTNVRIPNSVTSVGTFVFEDCSRLASVFIGSGVTNLPVGLGYFYGPVNIFSGCPKLANILVDANNPAFSSVNGVLFDKHKTTLWQYPAGLTGSYVIPNTVQIVGAGAFQDCTNLSGIFFPASVTNLADQAFDGCSRLKSVTIPNSVISIGDETFAGCTSLTNLSFGTGVASLEGDAFEGCTNLAALYFSGNAPAGLYFYFYPENIPATIYYLAGTSGWNSFYPIGLPTVMLHAPNPFGSVQVGIQPDAAVAAGAQWRVDGGILQPGGATVLGLAVGSHTISFTSISGWTTPSNQIVLVASNSTAGATGNYWATGLNAFICATNPDNTLTIVQYAGAGVEVTIPSAINGLTVTGIGTDAFSGYPGLTGVTIPGSVTSIGAEAFSDCSVLTNATISEGVLSIGSEAFYNTPLTSITIPGSVTNLGDEAFEMCGQLTNVTLLNGMVTIGDHTFDNCGQLPTITIPASVTTLGVLDFSYCDALTNIVVDALNANYASADGVLFDKSLSLLLQYPAGKTGSYAVPGGVAGIGDEAFAGCYQLQGVTFPGSLTSIGSDAFDNCDNLRTVTIPSGVTSIGDDPFFECWGLTNITVDVLNPSYASADSVLFDKTFTTLIRYPERKAGSYAIPGSVTNIAPAAFDECSGLTGVTIPGSVTGLGSEAFSDCFSLTNVTIANGVGNIGDSAFNNCRNLASVNLPNSVTNIGNSAFENCFLLGSVILPGSLANLGNYAFYGCSGLTNLVIADGLTSLQDSVFADCSSLGTVTIPASVTMLENDALGSCAGLKQIYFEGNAPSLAAFWPILLPVSASPFSGDTATVYYLPGTTGWTNTFGGLPTAPWYQPGPAIVSRGLGSGGQARPFGFTIAWATNVSVIVEACTNLNQPVWVPVQTNALVNGTNWFSDAHWTNYPGRFYRVRTP
jgi:hypothetical protein